MSQTEREYSLGGSGDSASGSGGRPRERRQRQSSRYFENAVYYRHNMSPLQIPERRI